MSTDNDGPRVFSFLRSFQTPRLAPAPAGAQPAGSAPDPPPADSAPVDKSRYHLFYPPPPPYLREMNTDRPDKTESPYTVDAGHFQMELDWVNFTRERRKEGGVTTRTETWAIAPINLKAGLCNSADLQLVLESYTETRNRTQGGGAAGETTQRGFGDITARLKYNFWGNDGGPTAAGVMAFVKLPTNQDRLGNNSVEGGVILPLAVELPLGFGLGLMTEVDFRRTDRRDRYHQEFSNSITLGHSLVGDLGCYLEFFSQVSTESGSEWEGSVDLGFTYGLTQNTQFDAGVNIGVTKGAADLNPFVGFSWRY